MAKKWKKDSCNNCGECCMRNPLIDFIDPNEWKIIIDHLENEEDGLRIAKTFNYKYDRYFLKCLFVTEDDISIDSYSEFHDIINDEYLPCPFLDFSETGNYYCSINDIKPKVCKDFHCDPNNLIGSEFSDCVLNFGNDMEYPECEYCQKYGFDEENSKKLDDKTDCEKGVGCIYFERRLVYFLKFCQTNEIDNRVIRFGRKLLDIIEKNDETFMEELKFIVKENYLNEFEQKLNENFFKNYIKSIEEAIYRP